MGVVSTPQSRRSVFFLFVCFSEVVWILYIFFFFKMWLVFGVSFVVFLVLLLLFHRRRVYSIRGKHILVRKVA